MSGFDKRLTRKNMMKNPEYCGNPIFIGWKTDDDGEFELNENGDKIPLFDICGKKMKPKKLSKQIRWNCTRSGCHGQKHTDKVKMFGITEM